MKKNNFQKMYKVFFLITSAVLLVIGVAFLNGCNKDTSNIQAQQTNVDDGSDAMLNHILSFKHMMEAQRDNPSLKSGGQLLQIDSTILDWEATINFTYCHSYLDLAEIVIFDTILDIPLVEGDSITVAKASEKYYDNILESIQDKYFSAVFQEKQLISVDLEPVNGGDSLLIKLAIGNSVVPTYPVYDWYYGELEGVCLTYQYHYSMDAAVVLAMDTRNHFYQAPPENCQWYFTNIVTYEILDPTLTKYINPNDEPFYFPNVIIDNYCDYLIYYAHQDIQPGLIEDVRCIEASTEMNFYKQNYFNITQKYLDEAPIFPEGRMKFQTSIYEGHVFTDYNNKSYLKHILYTKLGRRFVVCSHTIENIALY